jgi:hypothetical protein
MGWTAADAEDALNRCGADLEEAVRYLESFENEQVCCTDIIVFFQSFFV